MKPLRILLLSLLSAIVILEAPHLAAAVQLTADNPATGGVEDGNLISNGNFEKGMDGWELIAFQKKGTMAIDREVLHRGKPTLRIENTEGDHSFVRQFVKGKPHTHYRLSGYIKTEDVEPVAEGGRDGAVLMIGMTLNMTRSIQGTTGWRRMNLDFTTGDTTEIRVGSSLGTYARPVTGAAWFSDLSLVEVSESTNAEATYIPFPERAKEFLDPVELLLKSAPAGAIQKLRQDPWAQDAAAELNRYFAEYAVNKSIVLHTTVEAAQAHPDIRNAFRIRAASAPLEWAGGTMKRLSWLYFQPADGAAANSVKVGSEITVVGWIRRCEVVNTQEGLRLNFDLQYSKIENASTPLP